MPHTLPHRVKSSLLESFKKSCYGSQIFYAGFWVPNGLQGAVDFTLWDKLEMAVKVDRMRNGCPPEGSRIICLCLDLFRKQPWRCERALLRRGFILQKASLPPMAPAKCAACTQTLQKHLIFSAQGSASPLRPAARQKNRVIRTPPDLKKKALSVRALASIKRLYFIYNFMLRSFHLTLLKVAAVPTVSPILCHAYLFFSLIEIVW